MDDNSREDATEAELLNYKGVFYDEDENDAG